MSKKKKDKSDDHEEVKRKLIQEAVAGNRCCHRQECFAPSIGTSSDAQASPRCRCSKKGWTRRFPRMRSHCELTTSPNIDGISVCRETRSRIGSKQSANCAKKLAESPPKRLQTARRSPAGGSINICSLGVQPRRTRESFLLLGGSGSLPSLTPARWRKERRFHRLNCGEFQSCLHGIQRHFRRQSSVRRLSCFCLS